MTEPKRYALTDDLSHITVLDWVEGLGDVSTHYEVKFFRAFEAAKREMIADARNATLEEVYEAMITSDEIRGDCMRDAIRVVNSLRTQEQP